MGASRFAGERESRPISGFAVPLARGLPAAAGVYGLVQLA